MTLTQPLFLIKDCRFTFLAQNLARTVIMKSIVAAIFLILLVSVTNAFTVAPRAGVVSKAPSTTSLNMVFGNKKSSAQKAADKEKESKYWQGEWVCKDCGYIYNRVSASFVVDMTVAYFFRRIFLRVAPQSLNHGRHCLSILSNLTTSFLRPRLNVLVCTLRNRDLASVARSARALADAMQRK